MPPIATRCLYRPWLTRSIKPSGRRAFLCRQSLTVFQESGSPASCSAAAWIPRARSGCSEAASTWRTAFRTTPERLGKAPVALLQRRGVGRDDPPGWRFGRGSLEGRGSRVPRLDRMSRVTNFGMGVSVGLLVKGAAGGNVLLFSLLKINSGLSSQSSVVRCRRRRPLAAARQASSRSRPGSGSFWRAAGLGWSRAASPASTRANVDRSLSGVDG